MASYTGGAREATRIQALEEERAARRREMERQKGAIAIAASGTAGVLGGPKFAARSDAVEEMLKSDTVGLVTHEDFKARREYLEKCAADERERRNAKLREQEAEIRKLQLQKANSQKLSFSVDEDDSSSDEDSRPQGIKTCAVLNGIATFDDGKSVKCDTRSHTSSGDISMKQNNGKPASTDEAASTSGDDDSRSERLRKRPRLTKNPDADMKFLPDRERLLEEEAERERWKQEWYNEQERLKNEMVNVTYSYWDGTGHRRVIRCKKGITIGRFLAIVQTQFKQLRNLSPNDMMFIKEDLIIPHHHSFYDFIVSKARGKSGPLFNFDVVEDVRVVTDVNVEKQDAHAAKVVERRWYERNKHIFPASRWTQFDPKKKVCLEIGFFTATGWSCRRFSIPMQNLHIFGNSVLTY